MALEDFLVQTATVQLEPTPMTRDRLGGADRTSPWPTVVDDVPCLVRPMAASLQSRDDARRDVVSVRIYFQVDATPDGMGTRHRVVVDGKTYQVTGVVNINSLSEIFHVDCELIKST